MGEILATHFKTELMFEKPSSEQLRHIVEWINSTGDLPLISNILNGDLSMDILQSWYNSALINVRVALEDQIVGLATLSRNEAHLPNRFIEVCHCIVDSEFRRQYNGSLMVLTLTSFAKQAGFSKVVGRVVRSNLKGHSLLNSLRWEQIHNKNYSEDPSVIWYQKSL